MNSIDWEIKTNMSYDQLIVKLDPNISIIDYQLKIINQQSIESIIPIAIIKGKSNLIISAELGSSNTYRMIDAACEGNYQSGLLRLIQLSNIVQQTEEYLFLPQQILMHPELIRFTSTEADGNDKTPLVVIMPLSTAINHDDLVINELIPAFAKFYSFTDEMVKGLVKKYQTGNWHGLGNHANAIISEKENETEPRTIKQRSNRVGQAKAIESNKSYLTIPIAVWLLAALAYLILSKVSLVVLSQTMKIVIPLVLIMLGIITLLKTNLLPSSFIVLDKFKNVKRLNVIGSKSTKNCTELISRNADSYGMAILSEGLPGTPQENEGKRAFILLDEFLIGRDIENSDLHLDSKTVGRQHARISRHEGSYFITDLGSKNGTRLDGRRLNRNEEQLLPDRCRLQFADYVFFFQNEEPL